MGNSEQTNDSKRAAPPVDKSIQEAFMSQLGDSADLFASGEKHVRYYFYPTWRSQIGHMLLFIILSLFVAAISPRWEYFVLSDELFKLAGHSYRLHLPWLIFVPGFVLCKIFLHIYDAKYIIDERGVEAQIGLVSLELRQPRLRYEDIRGVEPQQTLWERILGIGSVLIGSAMTDDVEITMKGVPNPREIQLLVNSERDKRLKILQAQGGNLHMGNQLLGD